jgi:hypothetical protein
MILAAHQLNFMPYSGFWYKMEKADLFDLRYQAQYTEKGYIRRVKMRDAWCAVPVVDKPKYEPTNEVRIDIAKARTQICNTIKGRYAGAPYYKQRGGDLIDRIQSLDTGYLWEFNLELILYLRDVLGIQTPLTLGVDTIGGKAEGVLSFMRVYPGVETYLSGIGAKAYMEDTSIFDEAGIKIEWSRHRAVTHDSVVTLLMDYADPMEIIMLENEGDQNV